MGSEAALLRVGALVALAVVVGSALLTGVVRKFALARGVVDEPNERSSHAVTTPRGGGIAIVVTSIAGWAAVTVLQYLPLRSFIALAGGGAAVALVGWLDDRRGLSARVRLTVHVAAALWALGWLGGLPAFQAGGHSVALGCGGYVLGVLGVVWTLNLFNFMDGIDGIAALEAVFIGLGGALLATATGAGGGVAAAALVTAAAACGFLFWNWPPARIFMGDVGSGYLGYVIAVLALMAGHDHPPSLLAWLLLGGLFFVDATVTLIRRVARGEGPSVAHRSHAYQWLSRRWRSHLRVSLTFLLINVLWLLPLAYIATEQPNISIFALLGGVVPVVLLVLWAGAGRDETPGA